MRAKSILLKSRLVAFASKPDEEPWEAVRSNCIGRSLPTDSGVILPSDIAVS